MSSKSETFLVTGANGFIGSHLAQHFHREGAHVLAGVRRLESGELLASKGIEVVMFDLQKPEDFPKVLQEIGTIVNVGAWLGRAPKGAKEAYLKQKRGEKLTAPEKACAQAWKTNVVGNRNLIDAAIKANVQRFVDTSSIAVYGLPTKGVITEDTPTRPYDAYSETKIESEKILFDRKNEIECVTIRPGQVIGERDNRWTLQPFERVKNGQIVLIGAGSGTFHPTYIENLVRLYELAGESKEAVGQVYNAVDTTITFGEYIQYFERMLGKEAKKLSVPLWAFVLGARSLEFTLRLVGKYPPVTDDDVKFLAGSAIFSNEKAKRELGWIPTVSISQAMGNIEQWLRETGRLNRK